MSSFNNGFIELFQRREAIISVGPSTARGMGPKGTILAARDFLQHIELKRLADLKTKPAFEFMIDNLTQEFKTSLPKGGQHWGTARKFLNIFLRGVLYNRYLCEGYNFLQLEPWLEVPLDSHVAKGLHLEKGSGYLPRWKTVIGLSFEDNKIYQNFAEKVAIAKGIYRVHLDLLYWRGSHIVGKMSR